MASIPLGGDASFLSLKILVIIKIKEGCLDKTNLLQTQLHGIIESAEAFFAILPAG
ncbi:MAG: hypothetical protein U9Q78_00685 [Chloroflexota bacterium]|nr:hypothetical protein [Chloroflexota bacterium]